MRAGKLAAVAAVAVLIGACPEHSDPTLESIVEQTHDFPPGSELTVRNAQGSIRVYGSPHPGLQLWATKKAYSRERLDKIEVKVLAGNGSVTIDTIFPPKTDGWGLGDRSGTVDYIIVVPDSTRIRNLEVVTGEISVDDLRDGGASVRLTNGRMFSHNCFCNLDFAVTTGRLDFFYDWSEPKTFSIEGTIVKGNINAYLPEGSSFHVEAETKDGRIINRFSETEIPAGEGAKLQIDIGSQAGPRFRLQVTHGDIAFEKAY